MREIYQKNVISISWAFLLYTRISYGMKRKSILIVSAIIVLVEEHLSLLASELLAPAIRCFCGSKNGWLGGIIIFSILKHHLRYLHNSIQQSS